MDGKIEKLILLVSERPEIFDLSNKHYSNIIRKENIWREIGKELNESPEKCKTRWKSLRDSFQRSLKSQKTKSGQGAETTKKWKYFENFTFLLPYIKGRRHFSNLDDSDNLSGGNIDIDDLDDDNITVENLEERENVEESDSPIQNTITDHSSQSFTETQDENTPKKITAQKNIKASRSKRNAESVPDIFKQFLEEKKQRAAEKKSPPKTPLADFFLNLGRTVDTFPPYWQAYVKNKVFEIVSNTELMLLSKEQSPSPTQTPLPMFSPEYLTSERPISQNHTSEYPIHHAHPTYNPYSTSHPYPTSQFTRQYHTSQHSQSSPATSAQSMLQFSQPSISSRQLVPENSFMQSTDQEISNHQFS